jgi:hypothetical protein
MWQSRQDLLGQILHFGKQENASHQDQVLKDYQGSSMYQSIIFMSNHCLTSTN